MKYSLIQQVGNKITDLQAKLADMSCTMEESVKAQADWYQMITDKPSNIDSDKANELFELSRFAGYQGDIDMLTETLSMDLMQCNNRYVVTDEKQLQSPSGFHPSDRVFKQTAIAIHTDSLDNLPESNVKLYAHDLEKMMARYK